MSDHPFTCICIECIPPTQDPTPDEIELVVVGKRCVYLNDYRVAGAKPHVSENLPQHSFTIRLKDILDALPQLVIKAPSKGEKA